MFKILNSNFSINRRLIGERGVNVILKSPPQANLDDHLTLRMQHLLQNRRGYTPAVDIIVRIYFFAIPISPPLPSHPNFTRVDEQL
jgi:hypothetical protein